MGKITKRSMRKIPKFMCALACAFACVFALAACAADEGGNADSGVIQDETGYQNVVELGSVSARYPDDMVVVKQYEPTENAMLFGEENPFVETTVLFGDPEDYRLRFTLSLCEGVGLDEVEAYTAVAEQRARDRVAGLEEAAETESALGESFANAASVMENIEYAAPERVSINGSDGLIWYSTIQGEGDTFINMLYVVEVDEDTVGYLLAGYFQSTYDEDPAFWDSVLSTLRAQ